MGYIQADRAQQDTVFKVNAQSATAKERSKNGLKY